MRHAFNLSPDQIKEAIGDEGYFVIAGPTASGKSALALALANAVSGTIVNDSSGDHKIRCISPAQLDAGVVALEVSPNAQDYTQGCARSVNRHQALHGT